jgi:hypothetical protein
MIALLALAVAAPRKSELERYLEQYAAGELDALWEAASPEYRERTCLGDVTQCPDLGRIPLGTPTRSQLSCGRRSCRLVRTDTYDAPPLPHSPAVELDWIVTTDLEGRFAGVAVDPRVPRTPGAALRSVGRLLGLGCGILTSALLGWGALFVLLRAGASSTSPDRGTLAREARWSPRT